MLRECKNTATDTATIPTSKTVHSTTENVFADEVFHSGGKRRFYFRIATLSNPND